jgi:hypothetical protein
MFGKNGGEQGQTATLSLGPADKWILIRVKFGSTQAEQFGSPELPAEEAVAMLLGATANIAITELKARKANESRIKPPAGVVLP